MPPSQRSAQFLPVRAPRSIARAALGATERWSTAAAGFLLHPLYRLYERRIAGQVEGEPAPRHIGIILDGNRRHAERHGLSDPEEIYALGAGKLDDVLDWCGELEVPAVTLWVFSTDNWTRPSEQVSGILAAVEAKIRTLADDPRIHRRQVRVQAIGKLDLLPPSLVAALRDAAAATAGHRGMILTIAVAYGGRDEIVDAVRALVAEEAARGVAAAEIAGAITHASIAEHLYTAGSPDPDLIIRTSGEIRLSGFLLWQSAYSEFYFCDVPWPAFRKVDFLRAVRSYQHRRRRFGK